MGNVVQKGGTAPWRTLGRAARRLLLRMCRALSGRSVRFSRFFRGRVLQSAVVRGPRPPVLGAKWKRSGGNRELEEGLAGGSGPSGFGRKGGVELVAEKMGESQAGLQTRRPEGRRSLQPFFLPAEGALWGCKICASKWLKSDCRTFVDALGCAACRAGSKSARGQQGREQIFLMRNKHYYYYVSYFTLSICWEDASCSWGARVQNWLDERVQWGTWGSGQRCPQHCIRL